MARANVELVRALRRTASRLRTGVHYEWGHQGSCNCGHLAQTLTSLPRAEIHEAALQRGGEWADRAREYCPTSGFPIDGIVALMMERGLSTSDLADLEHLSAPDVLRALPSGRSHLERNVRADVVEYMDAWADVLARELG